MDNIDIKRIQRAIEESWGVTEAPLQRQLVYVAGPYRPFGNRTVEINLALARTAVVELIRRGYAPIAPWLVESGLFGPCADDGRLADYPDLSVADFLAVDRAQLVFCRWIYLIPGWPHSEGAKDELGHAVGNGVTRLMVEELDLILLRQLESLVMKDAS